jgi:hypothetical protein
MRAKSSTNINGKGYMNLSKLQQGELIGGIIGWITGAIVIFGSVRGIDKKQMKWWGVALVFISTLIIYSIWQEM